MKKTVLFVLLISAIISCGRFGKKDNQPESAERIVCLSKQYNEIIFALGAQENLVGVDISSTYPPEIKSITTVGYHRALSAEAILSLKPTLVIHDNNIGPEHVIQQLTDLKIPMKVFENKGKDIESTKALIREMGAYFHKEHAADSLCNKLDADMKTALADTVKYHDKPKVMVIHFGRRDNVYLIVSGKSTAGQMMQWAGGYIPVLDERGMKRLSAEAVAAANPDVLILTDFGYDRLGSIEGIKELPGVAATNAAKNNRIYRFEEHDLIYIGPRTGENVLKLQKMIHETK